VPTERGGKATYHGPGQIVIYPIFDLRDHGQDVRAFVRKLEQAIIDVLHDFDVPGDRRSEYPGVWVADRKIASIGLRVTKWVSFHGIALNVDCDLKPFQLFTPCGLADVAMTSIANELGPAQCPRYRAVQARLVERLASAFALRTETVSPDELRNMVAGYRVDEPELALPTPNAVEAVEVYA
jgi:lipoyl(octanoyl) transferase